MYLGNSPLLPADAGAGAQSALKAALRPELSVMATAGQRDKRTLLAAIKEQGRHSPQGLQHLLASLPPSIKGDLDVAAAFTAADPALIREFTPEVQRDVAARMQTGRERAVQGMAPEARPRPIQSLVSGDAETRAGAVSYAEERIRANPMSLANAPESVRNDQRLVELAISLDPLAIVYAAQNLWSDPDFVQRNFPKSATAAAQVVGRLVDVQGDDTAAVLLGNKHVGTILAKAVGLGSTLPPKTRAVVEDAYAASKRPRMTPF